MASAISHIVAKDFSETFFVVLDTKIMISFTSPHGVLLFLLEIPIFSRPDSECSHVSKQLSYSYRS